MKILQKLTYQNLKLNKKRTLVTIIGIILSTALISALSTMFFSMRQSLIEYEKIEKGNFHFVFSDVSKSDESIFKLNKKIESYDAVSRIGYAKLAGIQNEYKPYVYVIGVDNASFTNLGLTLTLGHLPLNEHEILVPEHLETNGKVTLKIGDKITLNIGKRIQNESGTILNQNNPYSLFECPDEEVNDGTICDKGLESIIDTEEYTYEVVGFIKRPNSNIESYNAPGYTFVTLKDNNMANNLDIYVRYNKKGLINPYLTTAEILDMPADLQKYYYDYLFPSGALSQTKIDQIKEALEDSYEVHSNNYLITLETGITQNETLQSLLMVCLIVTVIIIFTSVFCIKNSFAISLTEKIREYGMLRSIGATKKQIKKKVYFEGLVLGVIAIPLGILSGLLAGYILILISGKLLSNALADDMHLVFAFSPLVIVITILLGILTIFLSARKSAKKASSIPPITAIRNSEDISIKRKGLKVPKFIHKIFGIGGDISYKNLKRSRKKYRTTVISIIICSSVFIALSYFMTTAFKTLDLELQAQDYNVSFHFNNDEAITSKLKELDNIKSIKDYSITYGFNADVKDYDYSDEYKKVANVNNNEEETFFIYLLNEEKFKKYAQSLNLNYDSVKDQGILKNSFLYFDAGSKKNIELDYFDFKKGDTIKSQVIIKKTYENYEDGSIHSTNHYQELNIPIAKVTNKVPKVFEDVAYVPTVYLNYSYYENLTDDKFCIVYIDSKDADTTVKELENLFKGDDVEIQNSTGNAEIMQSMFTLVGIFLYGFITVIALIGITNIFNTITTNMNLRRREFATLKSIGMTNKEFNKMIRLESLFYGIKSLAIGVPIGLGLSYIIYRVVCDGDYALKYEPPILAIIITCLVVFLLIITIMHFSISKINKQNMIDTIRNENI